MQVAAVRPVSAVAAVLTSDAKMPENSQYLGIANAVLASNLNHCGFCHFAEFFCLFLSSCK